MSKKNILKEGDEESDKGGRKLELII